MKRLLALLAGVLGLGTVLRRRRTVAGGELGASPADELRAKLQEARLAEPAVAAAPTPDATPAPEPAAVPPASADELAARRRSVYESARGAIDELA